MDVTAPPLPAAFVRRVRAQLAESADAFLHSYDAPPALGLRVNPAFAWRPNAPLERVPWCGEGYYINAADRWGTLAEHEAGAYYLQEPSAMAAVMALDAKPGQRALDLCAAPGGKATQWASRAPGGALVANEPVPARARILSRNAERMALSHVAVTCEAPEKLAALWPGYFDRVLVDAPCSGEGMFRRHPETRAQWTEAASAGCAVRQRAILECAAALLKPGGRVVYSTCTFSLEENEGVVRGFLAAHPEFELVAFALPGLEAAPEGMLRIWPHQARGEGHFVAALKKSPAAASGRTPDAGAGLEAPDRDAMQAYHAFMDADGAGDWTPNARMGDTLCRVPDDLPPLRGVRVLRAGAELGVCTRRRFAPSHAFARLGGLRREIDLDDDQAARYLRGETLPCGAAPGFAAALYHGLRLGLIKLADGRAQNHYPKGLRRP